MVERSNSAVTERVYDHAPRTPSIGLRHISADCRAASHPRALSCASGHNHASQAVMVVATLAARGRGSARWTGVEPVRAGGPRPALGEGYTHTERGSGRCGCPVFGATGVLQRCLATRLCIGGSFELMPSGTGRKA
jgi:hypothetical protein